MNTTLPAADTAIVVPRASIRSEPSVLTPPSPTIGSSPSNAISMVSSPPKVAAAVSTIIEVTAKTLAPQSSVAVPSTTASAIVPVTTWKSFCVPCIVVCTVLAFFTGIIANIPAINTVAASIAGIANSPLFVEVAGNPNPSVESIEDAPVEARTKRRTVEQMLSHPKVRLLQYINEAGQVGIPDVREYFGVSRGTAKMWLRRLKEYLATDQYGRYVLNDKGKSVTASIHEQGVLEGFLYKKPKPRSISRFTSPLPLRKHRSVYDLIAVMLNSKDGVIFQSRVIKALGISHKNASPLLAFAESKGFIERIDRKSLPMPYSRIIVSEFWRVTNRGRDYLQRYNSLVSTLV